MEFDNANEFGTMSMSENRQRDSSRLARVFLCLKNMARDVKSAFSETISKKFTPASAGFFVSEEKQGLRKMEVKH